jgi:hypothetical protein
MSVYHRNSASISCLPQVTCPVHHNLLTLTILIKYDPKNHEVPHYILNRTIAYFILPRSEYCIFLRLYFRTLVICVLPSTQNKFYDNTIGGDYCITWSSCTAILIESRPNIVTVERTGHKGRGPYSMHWRTHVHTELLSSKNFKLVTTRNTLQHGLLGFDTIPMVHRNLPDYMVSKPRQPQHKTLPS